MVCGRIALRPFRVPPFLQPSAAVFGIGAGRPAVMLRGARSEEAASP
jgi:hypothetical protein